MSYNHYIASVGKIVQVAEALRDEPGGLSLQDVVSGKGYIKSSVHRILQSLRRHSYVDRDATRAAFLAALILDSRERMCGSISVRVPKVRFSPALAEDAALFLLDACRLLSEKLGAEGYVHPHHGEFTLIEDTNQPFHLSKEG